MDTLYQEIPPSGRLPPIRLIAWVKGILDPPNLPETMSEAAQRRQAEREAAAAQLASLRVSAAEELPALADAEKKALAHLERVTPSYQHALRAYDEARMTRSRRAHDLEYAQSLQERRISLAAEPVIAEFATGLADLHAASLSHVVVEEEHNEMWDQQAAKTVAEIWSNQPAILARIEAVMVAHRKALAMKDDPDQSNIRERLAALIEDLPDPDEMSKVHAPPIHEPSRRWPSYEESRAETLGMDVEDLKTIRSGGRRAEDRPARRSLLSRLTR